MKTCYKCKEIKNKTSFVKLSTSKDGYRNLCKKCHNNSMKIYIHKYPEIEKNKQLIKNYNITLKEYRELLKLQNNQCKICAINFDTISLKQIHIDHCHNTNKVRGILCHSCNTALGLTKENKNILMKMLEYIK